MNSLSAYALARELDRDIAGCVIDRITKFHGGATIYLREAPFRMIHVLAPGDGAELFPLDTEVVPSVRSADVLRPASGLRIGGVEALGMDRTVVINLVSRDGWDRDRSLLLRVDLISTGRLLSLFSDKRRLVESVGKGNAAVGPFDRPPAKPYSILDPPADPPPALEAADSSDGLGESVPEHTRLWETARRRAERLALLIGGIDPPLARAIVRESQGRIDEIWRRILRLGETLSGGSFTWHAYRLPGERARLLLYPVPLPLEQSGERFDSFIEAFRAAADREYVPRFVEFLKQRATAILRREEKKLSRIVVAIESDLERASAFRDDRHYGNLLVTFRHQLKPGLRSITLRDFSGSGEVTIPLDPAKGPEENIRLYFRKARKGEKGLLVIRNRKREIERGLESLRSLFDMVSSATDTGELVDLLSEGTPAAVPARAGESPERFKRFRLDEHHILFVGRNERENDLLTHRFASSRDLWFHAQGVSGSHVLLRRSVQSTPKRIVEIAASSAAWFSKARHSTIVPVIYTEKRYVRKPRGSRPGTAACSRSRTILVEPKPPPEEK